MWLVGTAALGASVLHSLLESASHQLSVAHQLADMWNAIKAFSQEKIWALAQFELLALITPVPEVQHSHAYNILKGGDKMFALWCWLAYPEGWSKLRILQIHLSTANPQTEQRPNDPPIPRQSFFRFEAIYHETKRESCRSTPFLSFTMQSHVFSHYPFSYCLVMHIVLRRENLVNIEIMRWAPKNPNLLKIILFSLVKLSGHRNSEWLCFSCFLGK